MAHSLVEQGLPMRSAAVGDLVKYNDRYGLITALMQSTDPNLPRPAFGKKFYVYAEVLWSDTNRKTSELLETLTVVTKKNLTS